jgi:sirohydrochlorin ferrochelatase
MSQRHLCIIARGSRRPPSNDEVPRLEERTAEQRLTGLNHLEVAFLEVDEPSIPQGLQHCAGDGAQEIIVFPYFHAAGTRVTQDIPEAIADFCRTRTDKIVRFTPHLCASYKLPRALLDVATRNTPEP